MAGRKNRAKDTGTKPASSHASGLNPRVSHSTFPRTSKSTSSSPRSASFAQNRSRGICRKGNLVGRRINRS